VVKAGNKKTFAFALINHSQPTAKNDVLFG
jgi:hypothetical protein